MKLYRDENNKARAEASDEYGILACFLERDVQCDKDVAIELLQYLEEKQGERIGNAYKVNFDDTHVHVCGLEDKMESKSYGREHFFQAVEAWIVFITD